MFTAVAVAADYRTVTADVAVFAEAVVADTLFTETTVFADLGAVAAGFAAVFANNSTLFTSVEVVAGNHTVTADAAFSTPAGVIGSAVFT